MSLSAKLRQNITKEQIPLPPDDEGKLAFVLHNILTKEECKNLIDESENKGYIPAVLHHGNGVEELNERIRKHGRCVVESHEYANILWKRVKPFIPPVFGKRKVIGLNERFRFLRYDPGNYFRYHLDASFERDNGEKSLITFQLYLNEEFEGGETTFRDRLNRNGKLFPVVPQTGSVLIFQHDILHEGSVLTQGRKYAVRSDIMFQPI